MAEVTIPIGFGSAAVRVLDSAEGKITSFTFGIISPDLVTAEDSANAILGALTFTGSLMAPAQYAAACYLESVYVLVHKAAGFQSFELPAHIVGTRSGSPVCPPQTALGMKKRTAFVGKTRRGRLYLPAPFLLINDVFESGRLASARMTTINAGAVVFLSELNTNQAAMYLLHTDPAEAPDFVETLTASEILRTQRRRLPRS